MRNPGEPNLSKMVKSTDPSTDENPMSQSKTKKIEPSPIGSTHAQSMRRRARNPEYLRELEAVAPYESIARIVIGRRTALDLTQEELAQRMGTSHSAISRIESGQHPTSVTTLRRLAEAFGTHLVVGFDDAPGEHDKELLIGTGRQLAAVN
jgi:ribosome-binding protein aMBF1 (putative translation factor)